MHSKLISPIIKWWVTPKLPRQDIFAKHNFVTQWLIHPVKRRMARAYLKFLRKHGNVKVIGITGSTGKTTTTEILASILKNDGKTIWSKVGIDPVYNIPNTILRADLKTKYIVLEMSVEYPGEMDYYLWLSKPDIGILINVDLTHTEYLGDKKDVAFEKGKLIRSLTKSGYAVLNKEDALVSKMAGETKANVIFFGENSSIRASNIKHNDDLSTDFTLVMDKKTKSVHLPVCGRQFVFNALAASAAAQSMGISISAIVRGLELYRNQPHRLNASLDDKYGLIFDDSYNSNPKAMEESLKTFVSYAKNRNKILVIGDMLELGKFEEKKHRELGHNIGLMKPDYLVGVGELSRYVVEEASASLGGEKCFLTGNYLDATKIVKPLLNKKTALFVKGSRSIHLDKLVESLK